MLRVLRAGDARRVPWRNGRGVTEELALAPAGATFERGNFDWRVARATVGEAGPFSAFPGFERVLVVVRGAGLRLEHGGDAPAAIVPPLAPYRFSGEWTTTATPLDGSVTDVNVLARRGIAQAEVEVLRPVAAVPGGLPGDGDWLLHLLAGGLELREAGAAGGVRLALGPAETLWAGGAARVEVTCATPGSLALLVRLRRVPVAT